MVGRSGALLLGRMLSRPRTYFEGVLALDVGLIVTLKHAIRTPRNVRALKAVEGVHNAYFGLEGMDGGWGRWIEGTVDEGSGEPR